MWIALSRASVVPRIWEHSGSSERGAFYETADPPQIQASCVEELKQQARAHSPFLQYLSLFPMTVIKKKITNSVASNHRNLFSYGSGYQKPKMSLTGLKSRYQQGCFLLEAPRENSFLAFSSFGVAASTHWLVAISLQSLFIWSYCLLLFCDQILLCLPF